MRFGSDDDCDLRDFTPPLGRDEKGHFWFRFRGEDTLFMQVGHSLVC